MKTCSKCKNNFNLDFFHKDKSKKDGLSSSCKECSLKTKSNYRKRKRKYLSAMSMEYYKNNKDVILQQYRDKYKNNDEWRNRKKNTQLIKEYGITLDDYNNLLEKQNYKCAICGRNFKDAIKGLYIDHNHETGKIRGLLCLQCNSAIGMLNENINTLTKAISYLKDNKEL
mgnify:CR=1 FL=1